ncbi:hypothetical protein OCU04_005973 [Sclerotinia nivalis]|uniref:Uncharacterized protein n=1 Tax=Sclerotinia nivalis TaxID=352851 RepID=A0A9X0AMZ0_9HELO|nr:hypothetical protein OCU04_005973 [Sclerotinia nivalis]
MSPENRGKSFYRFLHGFGKIIPTRGKFAGDSNLPGDIESGHSVDAAKPILPEEFNWFLLHRLLGSTIEWVDTIQSHLDFDSSQNTLYVFRYPSLAASCLPGITCDHGKIANKSVLKICSAPADQTRLDWPTQDDLNDLLREVLLSYRLLFW